MSFTVTRTGDLTSPLTVGYTTLAGTARPGIDFTPQTGTTAFAAGSAAAIISIPIFGNGLYDNPSLTFSLQLTDFATQKAFATGLNSDFVAEGDFNGDGKPDLAVVNGSDTTVSVLLNTTAPGATIASFATQKTFATTGTYSTAMAVGDINGDGKPDLVVTNFGTGRDPGTVSVLLNTTVSGATAPAFTTQKTFGTGPYPYP